MNGPVAGCSWARCGCRRDAAAAPRCTSEFAHGLGSATVLNAPRPARRCSKPAQSGYADVAQLVEHHLAKVRVAGSNPVVRSEAPDSVPQAPGPHGSSDVQSHASPAGNVGAGGVAEWLRQGPAKPCTRVRFPPPPRGRLAQWEHVSLTTEAGLGVVRTLVRVAEEAGTSGTKGSAQLTGDWRSGSASP